MFATGYGHHRYRDAYYHSQKRAITASKACARTKSLMESAITSREISDAFMPSDAVGHSSEIVIVSDSIGVPPAARTPSYFLRQRPQMKIARCRFSIHMFADGHERLCDVRVGETRGLQHRSGWCA